MAKISSLERSKLDRLAIDMLISAPLMDGKEMEETLEQLKYMAMLKSGKRKITKELDSWASLAYLESLGEDEYTKLK
ncbi:hypothetical protein [Methanococcus voltae]|uniref:Uncharacterized protein n=2 Tax=Methanococcus voltae TaxID=2188 RepID=A0A8J7USE4_METVO|nr:hypothetical protein [Methanococcus voltae]MBP2172541.1 hypothetical protein [Methanococcus voltae]MBP2201552.1 hypothetical protein [Methanococcus voltae]MCS3922341.1 hypothetical protein [Methanococcus voltae PS]